MYDRLAKKHASTLLLERQQVVESENAPARFLNRTNRVATLSYNLNYSLASNSASNPFSRLPVRCIRRIIDFYILLMFCGRVDAIPEIPTYTWHTRKSIFGETRVPALLKVPK